jgi:hypothetical protein
MPSTTATPTPTQSKVRITVDLPEPLVKHYERIAGEHNASLDAVVSDRLTKCRDHDGTRPIYFSDETRRELEKVTSTQLHTAEDVISLVSRLLTVRVDNIKVTLNPSTLTRLKSRALGVDFKEFIRKILNNELQAIGDGLR